MYEWENNPVAAPAAYGFESVGSVELNNEPWEFYILAVLKNEQGYYLTTDSGCSCPTPFENHTVDDLTGPLTAEQAREEITSLTELAGGYEYRNGPDKFEVLDLIAKVK
jgi:hypothetical protein